MFRRSAHSIVPFTECIVLANLTCRQVVNCCYVMMMIRVWDGEIDSVRERARARCMSTEHWTRNMHANTSQLSDIASHAVCFKYWTTYLSIYPIHFRTIHTRASAHFTQCSICTLCMGAWTHRIWYTYRLAGLYDIRTIHSHYKSARRISWCRHSHMLCAGVREHFSPFPLDERRTSILRRCRHQLSESWIRWK